MQQSSISCEEEKGFFLLMSGFSPHILAQGTIALSHVIYDTSCFSDQRASIYLTSPLTLSRYEECLATYIVESLFNLRLLACMLYTVGKLYVCIGNKKEKSKKRRKGWNYQSCHGYAASPLGKKITRVRFLRATVPTND